MPTPHIEAKEGDFAKTVIMPGDPLRAKFIVDNFLTDTKMVNNVRGVQGYTGYYKGKAVSVMASNMGNPSMGIYSYELFKFYNVENIIRIGTCGAKNLDLKLADIVIAKNSITNTNFANLYEKDVHELECSTKLLNLAKQKAKDLKDINLFIGNMYCTDTFYEEENQQQIMEQNRCVAVEMESASLYYNAKRFGKNAIALCSVSDHLLTGEELSANEREVNLKNMIILALEMSI